MFFIKDIKNFSILHCFIYTFFNLKDYINLLEKKTNYFNALLNLNYKIFALLLKIFALTLRLNTK